MGDTGYTGFTGPTGPNAIYENLALNNLYFPYDQTNPLLRMNYAPTIHIHGTGGVSGSFIQMYDSTSSFTDKTIFNLTSENNGDNDYSLLTIGNGSNTKNITIDGNNGEITANTFSGGTASFNYLTGSTASFDYLNFNNFNGGSGNFDYLSVNTLTAGNIYTNTITGSTASFNYLNFNNFNGGSGNFDYLSVNTLTAGNIYTNTITGSTASFNYVTAGTASFEYISANTFTGNNISGNTIVASSITCTGSNSYTNLTSDYLNLWNTTKITNVGTVNRSSNINGQFMLNDSECIVYSEPFKNEWCSNKLSVTTSVPIKIGFYPNDVIATSDPFIMTGQYYWAFTIPDYETWKPTGTYTSKISDIFNIGDDGSGNVTITNWDVTSYDLIPPFTVSNLQMPSSKPPDNYLSLVIRCRYSGDGAANANFYSNTAYTQFVTDTPNSITTSILNVSNKTISLGASDGSIVCNTITGSNASFNYVTGGTASFNYLTVDTFTGNNISGNTIVASSITCTKNDVTTISLGGSDGSIRITNPTSNQLLPTSEAGSISLNGNIKLRSNTNNNPTVLIDGSNNGTMTFYNSTNIDLIKYYINADNTGLFALGNTNYKNVINIDGGGSITISSPGSTNIKTQVTPSYINFYNSNSVKVIDINGPDNCYIKLTNNVSTPKQTIDINGANAYIRVNNSSGTNTINLDGANAYIHVNNSSETNTINLDGANANIQVYNSSGTNTIKLEGSTSDILLYNSSAVNTIKLDGANANIHVNNSSGTNTIKLDGSNGFISYPNTSISSGKTLNLSGITQYSGGAFSNRIPFTVDLIDSVGQLSPGLYSLTNLLSSKYVPVGALSFNFRAIPSSSDDNYLSLMIVANNNSTYNLTTWQTNQYSDNGICLSSSAFIIPVGTSEKTYNALFSINGMITITPNYPYLHILLCTQVTVSNWTFNSASSDYYFSPGSTDNNDLPLYLKPLS